MAGTITAARPRPRLGASGHTAWFWYGAVSMVVTAVLIPVLPDESEVVAGITSTIAMFVGMLRYRPRPIRPWVFLAAAQVALVVSLIGWLAYLYTTGEEAPVPTIMDGICLLYYPFFAVGLALFTRRQVGRSPWEGVLDAVLVALGVAAVLWTLVVDP